MITITDILDQWRDTNSVRKVSKGAADSEVLALASMATILLGHRAQQVGREDIEKVCAAFLKILNKERIDTTAKTYRMKR